MTTIETNVRGGRMRLAATIAVVFATSMALSACSLKIRVGNEIDMPSLQELRVGESTSEDVRALLGPPFGTGRSYLPFQPEHLEMWTYYYEIGTMSDDRRTFLFVFLDDGVFDGFMWFSSLPEILK